MDRITWLAIVGTFGDLGTSHKWTPPWPDLNAATKRFTRKALSTAVSLINARTSSALPHTETGAGVRAGSTCSSQALGL